MNMSTHDRGATLWLWALASLGAASGCSTSTPIGVVEQAGAPGAVVVTGAAGSGAAGAAAASQGPYVPDAANALDDKPFTKPAGLPDDWVGYVENYISGLDTLRLHFGVDAAGNQTFTVQRGDGSPPAPATDPIAPWPVPVVDANGDANRAFTWAAVPVAGFAYPAHQVTVQGARVRFILVNAEPWAPWCSLQTSYPMLDMRSGAIVSYSCTQPATINGATCTFADSSGAPCDVNHVRMCSTPKLCVCNATGCGAGSGQRSGWDITFAADHATGSVNEADGAHNLQLMPAPAP
jgi:hypothetical protein